jgi:hypothetical protein
MAAASELDQPLLAAVLATGYPARERAVCAAYWLPAGAATRGLNLTVDPTVPFHDRLVLDDGRFADAVREQSGDPAVRARGWSEHRSRRQAPST